MPYYIATVSISLTAKDEKEAAGKIGTILSGIRENKGCTPYVDQIKEITNNPAQRFIKVNESLIKKLNSPA